MNLPEVNNTLQILPDKEIEKELNSAEPQPQSEILQTAENIKPPLRDDDLFESNKNEIEEEEPEIHSDDINEPINKETIEAQQEEPLLEQKVEQVKTKPVKKPRKKKKLSEAHRKALALGRKKALETRRRKAAIRKKLREEKKAERHKAVEYEYEKFQTQKKQNEINRKKILQNETVDLNSISKFFDLMDKYENLKDRRKAEYNKRLMAQQQEKQKVIRRQQTRKQYQQIPQQETTKPKLKYGHLWN